MGTVRQGIERGKHCVDTPVASPDTWEYTRTPDDIPDTSEITWSST